MFNQKQKSYEKLIILLFAVLPIFCFAQLDEEGLDVVGKKMFNTYERQETLLAVNFYLQEFKSATNNNFNACIENKDRLDSDCFQ